MTLQKQIKKARKIGTLRCENIFKQRQRNPVYKNRVMLQRIREAKNSLPSEEAKDTNLPSFYKIYK